MTYSAKTIANYFISKAKSESKTDLTPMKLLKLVYVAHGWHLALTGKPLIFESIDAWKYGPVIDSLYHEFKKYKNNPITMLTEAHPIADSDQNIKLLNEVWKKYGNYTGVQLSNWSHEQGSPWYQTWHAKKGKDYNGISIDNELIRNYFLEL
jgi:uncharacterized phage-associated protein